MNPYDMLNVRDNASDSEIKKSYLFYKNKYNFTGFICSSWYYLWQAAFANHVCTDYI